MQLALHGLQLLARVNRLKRSGLSGILSQDFPAGPRGRLFFACWHGLPTSVGIDESILIGAISAWRL